jgi:putative acetyltransferase
MHRHRNSLQTIIRPETPSDHAAIYDTTKRAFAPMPFADDDDLELVNSLREAGALTLSLVATRGDTVVGHVAFSPALAADNSKGWYGLGPIAVEPVLQRQGIGTALINDGIRRLKALDAAGCVLVGDPGYYPRHGFKPFPSLAPPGQPSEYFMILPLRVKNPATVVNFHSVFG